LQPTHVLIPGLIVRDADLDADKDALDRLPLWTLQRYSPIAAADPPDGLVIDSTGADHLHGGEAAILASLIERLGKAGLDARAAVAVTWGAAHALARFAARSSVISAPGATAADIAALPVAFLRLSPGLVRGLRVLGFDRISDLIGKPRAPFALRFGPELGRRLDQAVGRIAEPIEPIRPTKMIDVRRVFGEPIGAAETIARYIGQLVAEICQRLEEQTLAARQLDLAATGTSPVTA
jgi:protein ImuB